MTTSLVFEDPHGTINTLHMANQFTVYSHSTSATDKLLKK